MYRIIEIEYDSYCNRKCDWCPNKFFKYRQTEHNYLDKSKFIIFLKRLREYDYKGVFSFSRYNEPFYDVDKLKLYIDIVKTFFPYNKIVCNTNGDFITEEVIKNIPIDELTIMNYDLLQPQKNILKEFDDKKVLYYNQWKNHNISDRGGTLKEYQKQMRIRPCLEPLYFLGINYDGSISPCCNIRNDLHKEYIIGTIEDDIETIQKNGKDFIDKVTKGKFVQGMPCFYCNNCGGRYTREKGGIEYE